MKLRCIAVDDENLGRKLLEENIRQLPFLELKAICKNAFEAIEVLQKEQIDLIFLDIQMPGMSGTKFIQSLRTRPMVIFVTAYSNYAVESYELDVIDYLMKPVSLERFTKAAIKALEVYKGKQDPSPLPATFEGPEKEEETFFVNVEYTLVKITIAEITHIEGMKDYVKIYLHHSLKPVLTKSTLKAMEEKLPAGRFMRVHKSFIVNLNRIESIRNHMISLGKFEIPVSEVNMGVLLKVLKYSK